MLYERCSVPIAECGLSEVKQFQTHLTEYQINIVSKEHQNSIIFAGPEAAKRIYLYCHDLLVCRHFVLGKCIVTLARKAMIK